MPVSIDNKGAALSVQNLRAGYPGVEVLRGFSVECPLGVTQVSGDAGAGKTTLLRALAATQSAEGRVVLGGCDWATDRPAYLAQVFWQDPNAPPTRCANATEFFDAQAARWPNWRAQALHAHLDGFGLAPHLNKPFHALSAGSRRKVWLAAALSAGAGLTLIDEATAALDLPSARYLFHAMALWAQRPDGVWLVSHWDHLEGVPCVGEIAL